MNWFGAAIRGSLSALWTRRWLFGVPIATCVLLATLHAVRLPDVYTARAVLEIKPLRTDLNSDLPTEQALTGEAIAETARDRLYSQTPIAATIELLFPNPTKHRDELIEDARRLIEYERVTDYSLRISLTHHYPERAKMALDLLIDAFLEEERRGPLQTAERNAKFYEEQVGLYAKARALAYGEIDKFSREHHATLPEQQTAITMELQQCAQGLSTERGQRTRLEAQVEKIRGDLSDYRAPRPELVQRKRSVQEDLATAALDKARKRVAEVEKVFNARRTRYQPTAREYVAAQADVRSAEELEQRLNRELRAATRAADDAWQGDRQSYTQREVRALSTLQRQREAELRDLVARVAEITVCMADAQARLRQIPKTKEARGKLQRVVDEWEKRHDEARREANHHEKIATYYRDSPASEVTRFHLSQPAILPFKPSGPGRMRWVLTGFLVGCVLGYGLQLLRRRYAVVSAITVGDLKALLPGALVVSIPLQGPEHRSASFVSLREVVFGVWVLGCVLLTVLALGAYKGWLIAPHWLTGLIGG